MRAADLQPASLAKEVLRRAYRTACGGLTVANTAMPRKPGIAVHYGGARIGDVGGPLVKVKRLAQHFPDTRWGYNVVYLLSNAPYLPEYALRVLKARRVPIVYNQNGVFYPGWYGGDWRGQNLRMQSAYRLADHVFFQSEFCRRTAAKFLGAREGAGEILYNAVDTGHFRPPSGQRADGPFRFLVTGKIGNHLAYRLESTIEGLALARRQGLDTDLIVSGWVEEGARAAAERSAARNGVAEHLRFTGPYTQAQAPAIYGAADAYVMTKHNDPCPNTVLEALACGLPVVYSASGGTPELVGTEAGVGLECTEDFEATQTPSAEAIAKGMLDVAQGRAAYARAARVRAVERFDIVHWITRHRAVFAELLETK